MPTDSKLQTAPEVPFARFGYLMLASLIQAVVLSVFIHSLSTLQWGALDRWPFLVSEFLALMMVWFGHYAIARELCWQLDLFDVFIPFVLGLLQCVPMLLLGMVRNDALWWFACYFGLANVIFIALVNARMKTPAATALLLIRRRVILCTVHLYFVSLAILACYLDWHIQLIGILFMIEQIGMAVVIYLSDVRIRRREGRSL
jgi:hypothetical protein